MGSLCAKIRDLDLDVCGGGAMWVCGGMAWEQNFAEITQMAGLFYFLTNNRPLLEEQIFQTYLASLKLQISFF